MSPTQIEEKNKEKEAEIFEAIKVTTQPLSLDSGATEHVHFKHRGPTKYRSQGDTITIAAGSKIAIREFKNEFVNLLLIGTFQQVHPVDLLTRQVINDGRPSQIYARATSRLQSEQRTDANQTRIIAGRNRYQTLDISIGLIHLSVREEATFAEQQHIGQANYCHTFCHTHGQQGSHDANQCRNETVCPHSQKRFDVEENAIRKRAQLHLHQQTRRASI